MKTQLESMMEHERSRAGEVWLTQPMGGGRLRDFTYARGMDEARRMASHLVSLGLPAGSRVAILAKNNAWWLMADLAIWMAGHVSVPIYPTLNAESVRQIMEHSQAELVFIGKLDDFAMMEPGLGERARRIVLPLGPNTKGDRWEDLVAKATPLATPVTRGLDELATIIYTSGSTGVPKGVMHSFRTMCEGGRRFIDAFGMTRDGRAISYLPLAHVAERACLETTNFMLGFHVFFAESLDTFLEDVKRARPTIFGSVPRLWLKFQSGVFAKMPPKKIERLIKVPILGGVVKKKILAGLGLDQVKFAICGSAPVPPDLLEWYRRLGLTIHELYGMTENFAVSHMVPPGEYKAGTVGKPLPGVSQRLTPEGEILVKSPSTMLGYYEAKALTDEMIDAEGWIHTGDRGEIDASGTLKITGRVKEQFKSSKGKYVAPAPIENRLLAHPFIEQALVTGVDLPQPLAIVVLSEAGKAAGDVTGALATLREEVNRLTDPHEQLDRLVVVKDEWTVDNGLLTPTMKLKRSALEARYQEPIKTTWANAREPVVRA